MDPLFEVLRALWRVPGALVRRSEARRHHAPYRGNNIATRLCLTGTSRFPLFISDDPKAL